MRTFMWVVMVAVAIGLVVAACVADDEPGPTNGTLTGILVAKGETWIDVKADGAAEPQRYIPMWRGGAPADGGGYDADMLATIKKLIVSNRVSMQWTMDEHLRVLSIQMLIPEEKEGTITGVVTAKGDKWIEVRGADGIVQRYTPRWIGGMPADGGGLDKDMLRTIAATPVGATVQVNWIYTERLNAVTITVLAPPAGE